MQTNWAGNHAYRAAGIVEPRSVAELQEVVASHERVRALGSRHSFNDIADTDGVLVSTRGLPQAIAVDAEACSITVGGGALYGAVAEALQTQGWALANLASLPHISIAGAVATGTHGSGDRNGSLSAAVRALEIVGPSGELRRLSRGQPDFDGSVVALGALGIVTRVSLDIEPTFEVRQDVFTGLPWQAVEESFDAITSSAYSVSLFTDWTSPSVNQVWLKSRGDVSPGDFFGATRAAAPLHMLRGAPIEALTEQGGMVGSWNERLPHFRMGFTPSRGEELQSEYLVPRANAAPAIAALRRLGPRMAHLLQACELRTVAGDTLWLSGAYGGDVVALHFTWTRDPAAVNAVLPDLEAALTPLGARPHWGKCFVASRHELEAQYPRFDDFLQLQRREDPDGKFSNAFLERTLGSFPRQRA